MTTDQPYHVLDDDMVRCEQCGRLTHWADAAETDTGYLCSRCDAEGDPYA